MEEPDGAGGVSTTIIFQAEDKRTESSDTTKKDHKHSIGERLRRRKSTPRPTLKGDGKKRFSLTPSPKIKPMKKKAYRESREDGGDFGLRNKRSLLQDLNEAAPSQSEAGNNPPSGSGEKATTMDSPVVADFQEIGNVTEVVSTEDKEETATQIDIARNGEPEVTEGAGKVVGQPNNHNIASSLSAVAGCDSTVGTTHLVLSRGRDSRLTAWSIFPLSAKAQIQV